jgi:hypothetical protein
MVAMRNLVFKLRMSQVTDVAEENQEPMADQVITMEPELNLSFCGVLFTFNKYLFFLASLVMCVHETAGLWRMDIVCVILCGCEIWCLTSRNEYKLRVVRVIFDWKGGSSKVT